jgi:O-antigen/teichoic acid export membrane protein
VGVFAGAAAAGFYRVAINLGQLFGSVVGPLQSVVYQRLSSLRGTSSPQALADAVQRSAVWVAAPLAALGAAAIPLAPLAVRLTIGARFAPAGGMAQVMVLLGATWVLFLWVRPLAFTLGEVRLWALTGLGVAIFSLGGFAVAVPAFGAIGAAWVRYIVSVGAQVFPAAVMRRRYARGRYAWRGVSTDASMA